MPMDDFYGELRELFGDMSGFEDRPPTPTTHAHLVQGGEQTPNPPRREGPTPPTDTATGSAITRYRIPKISKTQEGTARGERTALAPVLTMSASSKGPTGMEATRRKATRPRPVATSRRPSGAPNTEKDDTPAKNQRKRTVTRAVTWRPEPAQGDNRPRSISISSSLSSGLTIPPTSIEEHRRRAGHGPSIGLPMGLPEPPRWRKEEDMATLWPPAKGPQNKKGRAQGTKTRAPTHQLRRKIQPTGQLPKEAPPPEQPQPRRTPTQTTGNAPIAAAGKASSPPPHRNRTTRYMATERTQTTPEQTPTQPLRRSASLTPPAPAKPATTTSRKRAADEQPPSAHSPKKLQNQEPGNGGFLTTSDHRDTLTPARYQGKDAPCPSTWYLLPNGRRVEVSLRLTTAKRFLTSIGDERWILNFDRTGRLLRCRQRGPTDTGPTTQ
ncbi:uncharacterized protein LOC143214783 [Lasioglossum baleicum]|uniref:uncharacterized protein LOC143214783 n=1 Tax=Lasioglossum baleicum TaxID=434251 RepID=UPI003FCD5278